MKKKILALTFIALFTFIGGAFALKNFITVTTLYSYSSSTGFNIIPTYSTSAVNALATTRLNATYYVWVSITFVIAKVPGQTIYIVSAQ